MLAERAHRRPPDSLPARPPAHAQGGRRRRRRRRVGPHPALFGPALCERLPALLRHAGRRAGVRRAQVCAHARCPADPTRAQDLTPLPRAAQLFRASDAAYAPLAAARRRDPRRALRRPRRADAKFAAFAVGNAAFHSSALYAELAAAIPALVHRLRDDDARARANAAGALGNLARNADSLVGESHAAPAPRARAQRPR